MTAKEIYDWLTAAGMTAAGAAGMMGNLYAESRLKFNVVERLCLKRLKENGKEYSDETYTAAVDNGTITRAEFLHPLPGKQYGYGLCQWTSQSRKAGLYDLCKRMGVSIADGETQLDYLLYELKTSYKSVWAVLTTAATVREASDIVLDKFECPADRSEAVRTKRASYGQKYYDEFAEVKTVGSLEGLIARALAEVGYIEKASNKSLDDKTANRGTANYTKYARDVSAAGLAGCQGQAWCCTFQFWLDLMEFGKEKALKLWNMTAKTYVGYNCFATYNAFAKVGKVGMEPRLGAVPIFTFSHAGRVVKIYEKDGRKVWDCEEGNTSSNTNDRNGGQVQIKTREWNDPTVKGFCYIDYSTDAEPAKPTEPIVAGWVRAADGVRWWYQNSDGSYPANDWKLIDHHWFLFDADGYMLTGWQQWDGRNVGTGDWYYLNETRDSTEGQCWHEAPGGKGALEPWYVE